MRIKDVMKKNLVSIDGERKVIDACKLMGKMHIGSVLVTLENKPYGIFTERDLLSKVVAKGLDMKKAKVKNYASHPLITVDGNYSVRECARIMSDMKIAPHCHFAGEDKRNIHSIGFGSRDIKVSSGVLRQGK